MKDILPFQPLSLTHTLPLSRVSFLFDVPQWHWCCTSSCVTCESSSLTSRLHILSKVFLAPLWLRTRTYLLTKDVLCDTSDQQLHSAAQPFVLLTPAALKLIQFDVKNLIWKDKKLWDLQQHHWQQLFLLLNCWQPLWAACQEPGSELKCPPVVSVHPSFLQRFHSAFMSHSLLQSTQPASQT